MTEITSATFGPFITSHKFAVIHFWASWNGGDTTMKAFLENELPADLRDPIAFARLDRGPTEHWDLCRSHRVMALPLLELYRDGSLVATLPGLQKEKIIDQLHQLISPIE